MAFFKTLLKGGSEGDDKRTTQQKNCKKNLCDRIESNLKSMAPKATVAFGAQVELSQICLSSKDSKLKRLLLAKKKTKEIFLYCVIQH